jgi:hypothetical protein
MQNKFADVKSNFEYNFLQLYKTIQEREKFLSDEAKIIQYTGVLRYFMKFLQQNEEYSHDVKSILFRVNVKIGDVYYKEAVKTQDNSRYFLALEYYNQAMSYANRQDEKNRVLLALKDIYYYLNDEDALIKVEESWAENQQAEDKFFAYMFLAQNSENPKIKASFLEKALDEVMRQESSFYAKYQDTLNICSQLLAIYELLGEKEKVIRIKKLRENTLRLLN